MILKKMSGNGFAGVLNYVLHDKNAETTDRAEIIGGNMAGLTVKDLSKEFSLLRRLKPDIKNPVRHFAIRNADSDRELSKEEWVKLGNDFLKERGYDSYAVMVLHYDCGKPHMHIVTSQIKFDGTTTREFKDFKQFKDFCRNKENELGLITLNSKPTGNSKTYYVRHKQDVSNSNHQAPIQEHEPSFKQPDFNKEQNYVNNCQYLLDNKQQIDNNEKLCQEVLDSGKHPEFSFLIENSIGALCSQRQSLISRLSGITDKYQEAELLRQLAEVEKQIAQTIKELIRKNQEEAQARNNQTNKRKFKP